MVNKSKPRGTGEQVATLPITPKQTRNDSGNTEAKGQEQSKIPAVLPPHDLILAQIANIGNAGLAAGFEKHPADMGEPEALVSVVWVQVGVGVTVVGTVTPGPPLDRALYSTSTSHSQSILKRLRGVV